MKIIKILIIIFLFSISTTNILAITPTATPSATNTNLQEIQKIREVVQQKVKEKIAQIGNPTTSTLPKSFIGTISQINNNQIIINYKNNSQTLDIGDSTAFIDIKRNKIQLEKIKVGQDVLALGYLNSDNTLDTKRLIVTNLKTIENNNQVIIGKIVDISKSSPIISVIPSKYKNNNPFQITTDSNTTVLTKENKKSDIKNLVSGDKVIVIITPNQKIAQTFSALKIITLDTISSTSPTPTKTK